MKSNLINVRLINLKYLTILTYFLCVLQHTALIFASICFCLSPVFDLRRHLYLLKTIIVLESCVAVKAILISSSTVDASTFVNCSIRACLTFSTLFFTNGKFWLVSS